MLKHVHHYSPSRSRSSSSAKRDACTEGDRISRINHSNPQHLDRTPSQLSSPNCRHIKSPPTHGQKNANEIHFQKPNSVPCSTHHQISSIRPQSPLHPHNHHQLNGIPNGRSSTPASSGTSPPQNKPFNPLLQGAAPPHTTCPAFSDLTCSSCSSGSSSSSSSLSSIAQNTPFSASFRRSRSALNRRAGGILADKAAAGPTRGRPPDQISLDSSMSCSSGSNQEERISSTSSTDNNSKTTVRVWVRCLLQEMEYKTVCLSYSTTCRELVNNLLSKFRMKHRDPNLFYLAMEVTIRKAETEVRTCLRLEDDSFPAQLLACHPQEDSRLALRMRRGGLLRVYDGALSQGSNYKSLLVSDKTPCREVVALVLACNKVDENPTDFTLHEVCEESKTDRALLHTEHPMLVANLWPNNRKAKLEIRRLNPTERQRILAQEAPPPKSRNLNSRNKFDPSKVTDDAVTNTSLSNQVYNGLHSDVIMEFESCYTSESSTSSQCGHSSLGSSSSPLLLDNCDDSSSFSNAEQSHFDARKLPANGFSHDYQNVLPGSEIRPRRKLPLPPPDLVLMETVVDEDHPMTLFRRSSETPSPTKSFKTYNDYENYFYI